MISFEETGAMLDEIADALPAPLYRELNGGVLLLPEAKLHPSSGRRLLYVLGEYHQEAAMGRYIVLYYGSFQQVCGRLPPAQFRLQLHRVLAHELTHHNESLAGLNDLERKDQQFLAEYLETGENE
ncbi:MAG: metallopeptidase family protein [Oscillospiraceae bacterium]|nr:metallopeptidase family protein [Oscillospiraceae bacterium]